MEKWNYKQNVIGEVLYPSFEEWANGNKYNDIAPDWIFNEEYTGPKTYGAVYDNFTSQIQQYNTRRRIADRKAHPEKYMGDLHSFVNEQRRLYGLTPLGRNLFLDSYQNYYDNNSIITLPSPSGPEGIEYNDQRARYRMMTEYENLMNPEIGTRYWINNWQESPEYKTQDARYIDYRKKKGLPFKHYADGNLEEGKTLQLFADGLNVPIRNAYGEIWYPFTEEVREAAEENGSHESYLGDDKSQE